MSEVSVARQAHALLRDMVNLSGAKAAEYPATTRPLPPYDHQVVLPSDTGLVKEVFNTERLQTLMRLLNEHNRGSKLRMAAKAHGPGKMLVTVTIPHESIYAVGKMLKVGICFTQVAPTDCGFVLALFRGEESDAGERVRLLRLAARGERRASAAI